jgi:integrase
MLWNRLTHSLRFRFDLSRGIQRQLGHSSLPTTEIYLSHIAPKQVIDAISNRRWSS